MFTDFKLTSAYKNAKVKYFDKNSKYIFFSDIHRGDDSVSDEFARNQLVLLYALNYYYDRGYTYVEVGHNLKYHGSYIRSFSLFSECYFISIRRYRCTQCRVTHAIIPIYIIPYHRSNLYFENFYYQLKKSLGCLLVTCFRYKRHYSYGFT